MANIKTDKRTGLFESVPIPRAVVALCVPTIISSLVMVLYNLADTYFVGILNDPVQNAAVTLAGPVLLAFNAVNNLFGVGSSSMMSRRSGGRITIPSIEVLRLVFTVHCFVASFSRLPAQSARRRFWRFWARTR